MPDKDLTRKFFGGFLQLQRIGQRTGDRLFHHHVFAGFGRFDRVLHVIRRTSCDRDQLHLLILQEVGTVVIDVNAVFFLHRRFPALDIDIAPGDDLELIRIHRQLAEVHSVAGPSKPPYSNSNFFRHIPFLIYHWVAVSSRNRFKSDWSNITPEMSFSKVFSVFFVRNR